MVRHKPIPDHNRLKRSLIWLSKGMSEGLPVANQTAREAYEPIEGVDSATVEQAGMLFGMISELANALERMIIQEIADKPAEPGNYCSSILVGARALSQQIGWMADLGGGKIGCGPCFGDAKNWMMPPAYIDLEKKAVSHG